MEIFNPFTDRIARDIRNNLSKSFSRSLENALTDCYTQEAQKLLSVACGQHHIEYITNQRGRYDRAVNEIRSHRIDPTLQRALLIWHHGLFFEAHELLENVWRNSSGDCRKALQGAIKAVGATIHLQHGNRIAAHRLSQKAIMLLDAYGDLLNGIIDTKRLVAKLKIPDTDPPDRATLLFNSHSTKPCTT
jgi:hypothetical protein